MSVGSSTHFDISSRAIWGTKMLVSMSRNFWTYLGLPGSSGLPEKLEKPVISDIFQPKLDYFCEHASIAKDRESSVAAKYLVKMANNTKMAKKDQK